MGGALLMATGAGDIGSSFAVNENLDDDGDGGSGGGGSGGGGSNGNAGRGGSEGDVKELFADAFDESRSSNPNWRFNGQWWNVADGVLTAGPVSGWAELRAYAPSSGFRDGTLSLDVASRGDAGFAVLFGLSGNPIEGNFDGYALQFEPGEQGGEVMLNRWIKGVEIFPPLATAGVTDNFPTPGGTNHVEITTAGSMITASVDGQAVLSFADPTYSGGKVGLRLWNQADATFDNIRITAPRE